MVLHWLPLLDSQLFPAGCRPPVTEERMQTKASALACVRELVKGRASMAYMAANTERCGNPRLLDGDFQVSIA